MVDGEVTSITNRAPLLPYVQRASNIMDERDALNEDLREVVAQAKEAGYESKILREVIREYRTDPEERNARYAVLDTYRQELGLFADTPLGQATVEREAQQPRRRRRKQNLDEVEPVGAA
jgi:uncharacterized protein (UPF0335 family)